MKGENETKQGLLESIADNPPADIRNLRWVDDPFYWTFFVENDLRVHWETLDPFVRAAVFLTASAASRHLKESGVFDV